MGGNPRFSLGVADLLGLLNRRQMVASLHAGLREVAGDADHPLRRAAVAALAELPGPLRGDAALPGMPLVLDGEVAVFDERLVSRFDLLGEPGSDVATTRPVDIAFDVLHARGRDLRARPLEERRDVLERLVDGAHLVFPVRRLSGDGHQAWKEVLARGIEGYVGKDPASKYLSGGPTRSWLKAKVRHEGRFIVGGVVKRTEGWSLLLARSRTAASSSGDDAVLRLTLPRATVRRAQRR
jgi:hypothetical protein